MTKQEFIEELKNNKIDSKIVSFNNYKDGYCVRKNNMHWETLIRERGKEYDILGFPSESDALQSLLRELIELYGNKKTGDG